MAKLTKRVLACWALLGVYVTCSGSVLQLPSDTTWTDLSALNGYDGVEIANDRPDILMKSLPGATLPGVVLELKSPKIPRRVSRKRRDALLVAAARRHPGRFASMPNGRTG